MVRALAVLLMIAAAVPAAAQGVFGQKVDYARLTLHAGWAEDGGRVAGLRMELAPGWKTYWRQPGDLGVPPQFDWSGSENLAAVEVLWPAPEVFLTYGARTIGYTGRMVLPLALTPEDPAQPVKLRLGFAYGVCNEICIPAAETLALDIPADAPEDGAHFIRSALAARPVSAAEAGLSAACDVTGAGADRLFSAALTYDDPPAEPPIVVIEGPEGVWFGPAETSVAGGRVAVAAEVRTEAGRWIDRAALTMTVLSPDGAAAVDGCAG